MSKKKNYPCKAFDNAFRTVEGECDDVLIDFVNFVFHEKYDKTAVVVRLRNEHHIERKGDKDEKRITDSHFSIRFQNIERSYHMECESSGYSGSLRIRMFQYAVQTAIDDCRSKGINEEYAKLVIKIPNTALLVLRDKGNPPSEIQFEIQTPGGTVGYSTPVICVTDYSLDDMFERKLYFMLPFYFFKLENEFPAFDSDKKELKRFEEIYCDILNRIQAVEEADLSLRSKGVIIKQMECVTRKLAEKRRRITSKVGDIMGGRVVKMEWLERFDAAVAEGEARGEVRGTSLGEKKQLVNQVCRKLRKGKTVEQIAEDLDESIDVIKGICKVAADFAPDYDAEKVFEVIKLQKTA